MSAYDIGPKIGIDGEAEFRKQIQDINNGLKTLGSEAKVVASAFDGEESSVEALTAASDILNRTIYGLRERLDAQNKMLEESARMYGEADARTQKWQQAVNATQTELNKVTAQLDRTTAAMNTSGDATGKLTAEISQQEAKLGELQRAYSNAVLEQGKSSDQAKDLQAQIKSLNGDLERNKARLDEASGAMSDGATQGLNLSDVLSGALSVAAGNLATGGLQLLGDALSAYADFCRDAVDASTDYADSINTLAAKTDLSTKTLQELTYAAELMDVPVNTVTGSMVKLTRNMDKFRDGNANATEAFEKLGLSLDTVIGPDGQLRNAEDVFWVVIDALGQVKNSAEADVIANTLFGKSFQDLKPLIDQGAAGYKALADEAERNNYIVGTEGLQKLQAADDAFQRWDRTMEAVKNRMGVELAPVIEKLAYKAIDFAQAIDWERVGNATADVLERVGNAVITVADNLETIGEVVHAITNPVDYLLDKLGQLTGVSRLTTGSQTSVLKSAGTTSSYAATVSTPAQQDRYVNSNLSREFVRDFNEWASQQAQAALAAGGDPSTFRIVYKGSDSTIARALAPVLEKENQRRGINLTGW